MKRSKTTTVRKSNSRSFLKRKVLRGIGFRIFGLSFLTIFLVVTWQSGFITSDMLDRFHEEFVLLLTHSISFRR